MPTGGMSFLTWQRMSENWNLKVPEITKNRLLKNRGTLEAYVDAAFFSTLGRLEESIWKGGK